jgi:hypothetical protein
VEAAVVAPSRIIAEGKTPGQWVAELAARGIPVSERSLRERARALGACRLLGNAMILLPEHIDRIFGLAPREPDVPGMLAAIRKAVICESPQDRLAFDCFFESPPDGNVYFLLDGSECVKIGFAKDIERRINTIRAGSSRPLRTLATVPAARSFEGYLHSIFKRYRRHGEWFEITGNIAGLVNDLEACN